MQYTVLISRESDALWRAIVPGMPKCEAEAKTRDQVIAQIKECIAEALRHTEVIQVEVPGELCHHNGAVPNPKKTEFKSIHDSAGIFRDDPTWGEMFDEIERRRNERLAGE
jgi:predicted RNase H-like HicB family nuclease